MVIWLIIKARDSLNDGYDAVMKNIISSSQEVKKGEADLSTIDPGASLRDQLDIDSVDFLNFVIAIHSELGVEIPEADLPKLSTVNGCVAYLFSKATP